MAGSSWVSLVVFTILALHSSITKAALDIGVTYQMYLGNDLPSANDTINLFNKYGIGKIRLHAPNPEALNALKGTQISVTVGVPKDDIPIMAASLPATASWFGTNIQPYINDVLFSYIVVGNDDITEASCGEILTVMQNLQSLLNLLNLHGVKITTAVSSGQLGSSYPPSTGAFTSDAMKGVLQFLSQQGSPLMISVYPYYAYAADPSDIGLEYAQFSARNPVFSDNGLLYFNLFDAMVDSFYYAMERLGVGDVNVVVGETGWPSAGNGDFTTPMLAATYNQNFMIHMVNFAGTPKRRGSYIEGFIHTMFNENLAADPEKQNFGLFFPNMMPVYPMFTASN